MHHKREWGPRHSPWVTACHENLIIPSNAHGGKLAGSLRRDFPRRLIESRVNNHSTYLMTWMMSVSHARSRKDSRETWRIRFPHSFLFFQRISVFSIFPPSCFSFVSLGFQPLFPLCSIRSLHSPFLSN